MAERKHMKTFTDYLVPTKDNAGYVTGKNNIRVYVPCRYEIHGILSVGNKVNCLGIFEAEVDGEKIPYYFRLPAMMSMHPSGVSKVRLHGDIPYYRFDFRPGDIFMESMTIIKQDFILFAMFIEFIRMGNVPPFMTYDDFSTMFDSAQVTCGATLQVPHAILEIIIAFCARDRDNLTVKYRHTDMKKPLVFLALKDTTHIRDTTTPKLMGSHLMNGINNALVNQSTQRSELEDILRS